MATETLLVFGDSSVDIENAYLISEKLGQPNPFKASIYNGSGNIRPSNGDVLSQYFALDIGWDGEGLLNINFANAQPQNIYLNDYLVNFAVAGATSGKSGSSISGTEKLSTGLLGQVGLSKPFLTGSSDGVDAVISVGTNDVLDAINDSSTKRNRGIGSIAKRASKKIVNNIKEAYSSLSEQVESFVILGLIQTSEILFVEQSFEDSSRGMSKRKLKRIDNVTTKKVNKKLDKAFRNNSDVFVVDSAEVWSELENPAFLPDNIHPTTNTYREFSELIAPDAITELGIGF